MTCYGVFDTHNGENVATYRLMGRPDLIELCAGCAAEAMRRTVLDRRADPDRPDRGRRWALGPIGRRRAA